MLFRGYTRDISDRTLEASEYIALSMMIITPRYIIGPLLLNR